MLGVPQTLGIFARMLMCGPVCCCLLLLFYRLLLLITVACHSFLFFTALLVHVLQKVHYIDDSDLS